MIALDFFSTSSSLKLDLGSEGGGVGALSRLTAKSKKKKKDHKVRLSP